MHLILWTIVGVIIIVLALLIIGNIATTRFASAFDLFIKKVPFYSTIKDIVDIFNSSKKGKNEVLVVAIKGFTQSGYNIGLFCLHWVKEIKLLFESWFKISVILFVPIDNK
jgi:uncharacterized membrane protein